MKRVHIWPWVRLGVALGIVLLIAKTYAWRHYEGHQLPTVKPTPAQPTLETKQITMNELHLGHKVWTIHAVQGSYDETRKVVNLSQVTLNLFQREQHVATIHAPNAELNTGTRDILLAGGANGQAKQRGVSFTARRVQWYGGKQILLGGGGVVLRQGAQEIQGDQFRADVALERVQLTGDVQATLHPLLAPVGLKTGGRP